MDSVSGEGVELDSRLFERGQMRMELRESRGLSRDSGRKLCSQSTGTGGGMREAVCGGGEGKSPAVGRWEELRKYVGLLGKLNVARMLRTCTYQKRAATRIDLTVEFDTMSPGLGFRLENISSEMARVTAGYIQSGALAHIQELDSWAGNHRLPAFLRLGAKVFLLM